MLGKPKTLKNSITHETNIKLIEINSKFSLFESTFLTTQAGKTISSEFSTGVSFTKHILNAVEESLQVKPHFSFILLTDEMKRLLRLYGFPNHTSHSKLYNPEIGLFEDPLAAFEAEYNKQELSMSLFLENPELIDLLALADHTTLTTKEVVSGKIVNQAIYADNFKLSSHYLSNFKEVVEYLVKHKRFAYRPTGYKDDIISFVPGCGSTVTGYINFSDDEWMTLLEECEKHKESLNEKDKTTYRYWEFPQLTMEKNFLGISESYYGYEKNDIYYSIEDMEDEDD